MRCFLGMWVASCWIWLGLGQAWGHDFWLEPATYQPAPKSALTVGWRVGMEFKGAAYKRKNSRIQSFVLVGPDGKRRPVPGQERAEPAGRIVLQAAVGAHALLYRSHRAYIKLAPKKFEKYLRHEGIGHIIKRREARKERKKAGTEWYSRCAKALLWVGGGAKTRDAFARPLGLPFELVTLNNPYQLAQGEPLLVQALYQGKPLRGQVITAYHRQGSHVTTVKGTTNATGLVKLKLPKAGPWLVKSIYMFRTPKGSKADWESLWASLTFARKLPPPTSASASRPASSRKAAVAPKERASILRRVAAIHGAPGPFAVAGYLMGVYAQRHWKQKYGGWKLLVRHYTPAKVQWSCVADGVQAATGVSPGKLNLQMRFVKRAQMRTVFIHKPTQKKLTFRLKPSFVRRYLNTPRRQLQRAGAEILGLPFEAIFTVLAR